MLNRYDWGMEEHSTNVTVTGSGASPLFCVTNFAYHDVGTVQTSNRS